MNFGQIFSHLFGQTLQPKELVWWPAVKPDHICVFVAPPCSYPGTTKQYTKTSKIHNHHHHHQRHLPFSRYHHQQPTYMYIYKYLHIHMSSYIMNIIRMCIYNAYNICNIKLFSNTKAQGGCVLGSGSLPGTSTEKGQTIWMHRQDKRELVSIRIVVRWRNCMLFTQHFKHSCFKAKLAKSCEFKTLNVNMYGSLSNILWIFTSILLRTGWRTSLIPLLHFVLEKNAARKSNRPNGHRKPTTKTWPVNNQTCDPHFPCCEPNNMNLPATARLFFRFEPAFWGPQHGTMGKQPVKTVVVTHPSSNLAMGFLRGSWAHDRLRLALFKSRPLWNAWRPDPQKLYPKTTSHSSTRWSVGGQDTKTCDSSCWQCQNIQQHIATSKHGKWRRGSCVTYSTGKNVAMAFVNEAEHASIENSRLIAHNPVPINIHPCLACYPASNPAGWLWGFESDIWGSIDSVHEYVMFVGNELRTLFY